MVLLDSPLSYINLGFFLFVHCKGAASVMVARGAMWNASIFSPKGKLHWEDVKKKYIRKVSKMSLK